MNTTAIAGFRRGVLDTLPILIGVMPFGVAFGIVGLTVGLTPLETVLMSLLVFAGAAQFISATMLGMGMADFSLIVFTTLLINLRHLLMGASLAPHLARLPLARQALLAFGMVDETYAITIDRVARHGYSESHQLGANTAAYLAWFLSTLAGVLLGEYIPDPLAWGLDFAMPATFLAMLIPRLDSRTSLAVCLAAAVVAVAAALSLPGKWYIILAALAATIVGGLLEPSPEKEAKA
ncbi:AzlC family ABC transporter permease [Anaeroselena agilis]|uniref:AzlC family ABC transporter permease n=1 Tax=Anaeroselena agilis TaxID=3063788 RepID=A0ABU3P3F9_9FIRM|nr:AzlC family ABC transporter permease [Selenomonadales bacterium 4137-cl]